jgi:hypothetical protein
MKPRDGWSASAVREQAEMANLILLALCTVVLSFYIFAFVQFVRDEKRDRATGRRARPTVIRPDGTGAKPGRR